MLMLIVLVNVLTESGMMQGQRESAKRLLGVVLIGCIFIDAQGNCLQWPCTVRSSLSVCIIGMQRFLLAVPLTIYRSTACVRRCPKKTCLIGGSALVITALLVPACLLGWKKFNSMRLNLARIPALEKELETVKRDKKSVDGHIANFLSQICGKRVPTGTLESVLGVLVEGKIMLEKQISDLTAQLQQQDDEFVRVSSEKKSVDDHIANFLSQVCGEQVPTGELDAVLGMIVEEKAGLERQIADLTAQLHQQADELERVSMDSEMSKASFGTMRRLFEEKHAELVHANKSYDILEEEIQESRTRIKELLQQRDQLLGELQFIRQQYQEKKGHELRDAAAVESLDARCCAAENITKETRERMKMLTNGHTALCEDLVREQGLVQELQGQIKRLLKDQSSLKKKFKVAKKDVAIILDEKCQLEKTVVAYQQKNQLYEEEIEECTAKIGQLELQVKNLLEEKSAWQQLSAV